MQSNVLFAPMAYSRYDSSQTLPAKFSRVLKRSGIAERLRGKTAAIKMHVGDGLTYSTIPPVFVRTLVDFITENGGSCFITDHYVQRRHPERRGYTDFSLGCPILDGCGYFGKYYYTKEVDFKKLRHVDIAGLIHDADILIDFSHVKGHGSCGMGGACKNIAMGCVTDRTRHELHSLEGGLIWNDDKCTHCGRCIKSCNHDANRFTEENNKGAYSVNYHACTLCQHCVKVCPTDAIVLDAHNNEDFQAGMALATKTVVDLFDPADVYYINLATAITALCDCWGMTTPSLVPDIGLFASNDIVAIEAATLDSIKLENLILEGIPQGYELGDSGHLFERLHGKDPYVQVDALAAAGLGTRDYLLETVK